MPRPGEWKVTQAGVESDYPVLPRVSFDQFMHWTQGRLRQNKETDFDEELNEISENLFPEIDPVSWAQTLIFTLSPFNISGRVESVIKTRWTFGFATRIRMFSGYVEENKEELFERAEKESTLEIDSDKKRTYEFVICLRSFVPIFYHTFTRENLESFISQAKALDYPAISDEERKRRGLLELFEGLLKVSRNQSN